MEVIYANRRYNKRYSIRRKAVCGVYRATFTNSTNGKCYIGYSKNIRKRVNSHQSDYIKPEETHLKFYRAISKYGWDNIHFELCEECSFEILQEREVYWSNVYDSYRSGYNSVPCGTYNPMEDPVVLARLRERRKANKEKKIAERTILLARNKLERQSIITNRWNDKIRDWPEIFTWTDVRPVYSSNTLGLAEHHNVIHVIGKRDGLILYRKGAKPVGYDRVKVLHSKHEAKIKVYPGMWQREMHWWTPERRARKWKKDYSVYDEYAAHIKQMADTLGPQ